jgi:hypothetical protein
LQLPERWGDLRKNPFCGGGMDNFSNHSMFINKVRKKLSNVSFINLVNIEICQIA